MFRGDDKPQRRRNISHLNTTPNFFNDDTAQVKRQGKRPPSVDNAFDRSSREVYQNIVRKRTAQQTVKNNESSYSITKQMGFFGDEVRSRSPKKLYPHQNALMFQGTNELGTENKKYFSDMRLNFNSIRKVHEYLDSSDVKSILTQKN